MARCPSRSRSSRRERRAASRACSTRSSRRLPPRARSGARLRFRRERAGARAGVLARSRRTTHALGLETIYEGYLVHYGRSRLFAPADRDTALLLGDYLYAHGLVRIAETGDVKAVSDLAELISRCAQLRAEGSTATGTSGSATSRCARERRAARPRPSDEVVAPPSPRTPGSWDRVAAMLAAFLELLAQAPVEEAHKTAAEEGRDIILSMLVVGLIFVGVAAARRPVPARRPQAAQQQRPLVAHLLGARA